MLPIRLGVRVYNSFIGNQILIINLKKLIIGKFSLLSTHWRSVYHFYSKTGVLESRGLSRGLSFPLPVGASYLCL